MKNKSKVYFFLLGIILIITIICSIIIIINKEETKQVSAEILPQEEISEEQYRQTKVKLYFINKQTGEIQNEIRMVDVKILINSPYYTLIQMLFNGPKKDELSSYIPSQTKINKIEFDNGTVKLDVSNDFLEINNLENKQDIIKIIEMTLKELLEIDNVEITVDGTQIK